MSSGAYPSCGSGRSFSIGHLNIFFYICFSIGSGSGQTIFKYPNNAKPCSLAVSVKKRQPSTKRKINE
jgi:hypothetical protein